MKKPILKADETDAQYQAIFGDVSRIIDDARQSATRSVNAVMTAAYWLIGQRIVEFEQSGEKRAEYGTALIERLAVDMRERFGRGFSRQNIWQMRQFYLSYPPERILQTVSGKSSLASVASHFPLLWSAWLLSVKGIEDVTGTILLTPNERWVSEGRRDHYWFYVITNCAGTPKLQEHIRNSVRFKWNDVTKIAHCCFPVNALA